MRVGLLGGFRVERAGVALPESSWQRRTAKTLVKVLAVQPTHKLHREQILETLWPDVPLASARNGFAKALHAARSALEPGPHSRGSSAYLRVRDEMLELDRTNVAVDADHFRRVAEDALRAATVSEYERALATYTGELLPEDRYEDWALECRNAIAELRVLLLLGLSETLERQGLHNRATGSLRMVLREDSTREDVHRRLMRVYAEMGARSLAIRQFEACRDALRRELTIEPDRETQALYEDVLANRIRPTGTPAPATVTRRAEPPSDAEVAFHAACVGREPILKLLREHLGCAEKGDGRLVLVTGEAGVGKTRLVSEFVAEARRRELWVIEGGAPALTRRIPYGPFAVALEDYVASRSRAERADLAACYPAMMQLVPSLCSWPAPPAPTELTTDAHLYLLTVIARFLTEVAADKLVLMVLGDLQGVHASTVDLLEYLVNLASKRRWLIVGTLSDEWTHPGNELSSLLAAATHDQLCFRIHLNRLDRAACRELVQTLLPDAAVDDDVVDDIYGHSLGNPLFVEELVREVRPRQGPSSQQNGWRRSPSPLIDVPLRVRALVEAVLSKLGESERRLLGLAALAGSAIGLADLRRAAGALQPPLHEEELFHALDRALDTRILVEGADSYRFGHPMVQAAVYEKLSQHRRTQLTAALGGTAQAHEVPRDVSDEPLPDGRVA